LRVREGIAAFYCKNLDRGIAKKKDHANEIKTQK
jgi:hypothetical protein